MYAKCLVIEPRYYGAAYAKASCLGSLGVDDDIIVKAFQKALQIDKHEHTNSGTFSSLGNHNFLIFDG
jgi:hypothetical protein